MYESHGGELIFDFRVEGILGHYLVQLDVQLLSNRLSLCVECFVALVHDPCRCLYQNLVLMKSLFELKHVKIL